ncbi:MAG: hypothetical protein ACI9YU_001839 [Flavobacteriales bacterium]
MNLVSELTVSPNPSIGIFRIVFPTTDTYKIEVSNAVGQTVIQEFNATGRTNIDLSDQKPGVYFLKSNITAQFEKSEIVRLIIQ